MDLEPTLELLSQVGFRIDREQEGPIALVLSEGDKEIKARLYLSPNGGAELQLLVGSCDLLRSFAEDSFLAQALHHLGQIGGGYLLIALEVRNDLNHSTRLTVSEIADLAPLREWQISRWESPSRKRRATLGEPHVIKQRFPKAFAIGVRTWRDLIGAGNKSYAIVHDELKRGGCVLAVPLKKMLAVYG